MVNLSLHLKLGMFHVFVTEDPVKQKGILVFVLGEKKLSCCSRLKFLHHRLPFFFCVSQHEV